MIQNPARPLITRVRVKVRRVLPCHICCVILVKSSVARIMLLMCEVKERKWGV